MNVDAALLCLEYSETMYMYIFMPCMQLADIHLTLPEYFKITDLRRIHKACTVCSWMFVGCVFKNCIYNIL